MADFKFKVYHVLDLARKLFGEQAESIANQEAKVQTLLVKAGKKIINLGKSSKVKQVIEPIFVFIRMVKAHFLGVHKLSNSTLGLLLLALIYFLSPFDLVPDFMGFIGFVDDVSVILAVYTKLKMEINIFLEWEEVQTLS